jgi:hypothetical protein
MVISLPVLNSYFYSLSFGKKFLNTRDFNLVEDYTVLRLILTFTLHLHLSHLADALIQSDLQI